MTNWPQASPSDRDLLAATNAWLADIPAPPDALPGTLQGWVPWTDTTYGRGYTIYQQTIDLTDGGQASVEVHGWQHDNGTVDRSVVCDIPAEMNGQDAAAVAAALTDAASRLV